MPTGAEELYAILLVVGFLCVCVCWVEGSMQCMTCIGMDAGCCNARGASSEVAETDRCR